MKIQRSLAAILAAVALASAAYADDAVPSVGAVALKFNQPVPNVPGKSLMAVEVTLAPGQVSVPHRHAKSAFIMAYVLAGTIRNQIEGEPAKVYRTGETWMEAPGAHHIQAVNLSKTKPARLLAVFVVDSNEKDMTVVDPK